MESISQNPMHYASNLLTMQNKKMGAIGTPTFFYFVLKGLIGVSST